MDTPEYKILKAEHEALKVKFENMQTSLLKYQTARKDTVIRIKHILNTFKNLETNNEEPKESIVKGTVFTLNRALEINEEDDAENEDVPSYLKKLRWVFK